MRFICFAVALVVCLVQSGLALRAQDGVYGRHNIELAKTFAKVTTEQEDVLIRQWIDERLLNDERFVSALYRVIQGHEEARVAYSTPSLIGSFAQHVDVRVALPPGATRWSWSRSDGLGVEGYEAVYVYVVLKDGRGTQAFYCHRNLAKIDPDRRTWK